MSPTRAEVIRRLHVALTSLSCVHAAWLEGADANHRADPFSDIDLWLDVDAADVNLAFSVVREKLEEFGPLDLEHPISHPDPQLHQRFFRSSGLSKFWFLDVVVQEHGRDVTFGPQDPFCILFDHAEVVRLSPLQNQALDKVRAEAQVLNEQRWRWILVEKEVQRGHGLEALAYYHGEVLAALVELLRLRFCPSKQGYGLKHLYQDLPGEVVQRLEGLYSRTQIGELQAGLELSSQWFDEVFQELISKASA